jgi:hypothetical protein
MKPFTKEKLEVLNQLLNHQVLEKVHAHIFDMDIRVDGKFFYYDLHGIPMWAGVTYHIKDEKSGQVINCWLGKSQWLDRLYRFMCKKGFIVNDEVNLDKVLEYKINQKEAVA